MSDAVELKKLLETIFDDGLVEPAERSALSACTEAMDEAQVIEVFKSFLSEKWGEAMADDVITPQERNLLGKILVELGLQLNHLPHQAQLALKDVV